MLDLWILSSSVLVADSTTPSMTVLRLVSPLPDHLSTYLVAGASIGLADCLRVVSSDLLAGVDFDCCLLLVAELLIEGLLEAEGLPLLDSDML